MCFWKPVHPCGLDWESKSLLEAWCYNFGLAQRSQEHVSAPLEAETAFPVQRAKSGRQTKVFYTSAQSILSRLFQTKSLMFMPVKFHHEMRTSFPSLRFETMQMAAPGHPAWDVQTCLFYHFKAVHSDVSQVNLCLPKYIVGAKEVIKLRGEAGSFPVRLCSLSHSLWMSLYLLFAEQEMHY